MNKDNYSSLEAAKRLVDAGIVLETDCYWNKVYSELYPGHGAKFEGYEMQNKKVSKEGESIPAPCMAEVWRELPWRHDGKTLKTRKDKEGKMEACYDSHGGMILKINTNPTDALVDLLIWVRKEKV